MLLYLLSCLALASALPTRHVVPSQFTPRVVNGLDATPGQFPWQGSLQQNGRHFCGCSLISPTFALSAAHCWSNFVDAGFGGTDYHNLEQTIRVEIFHQHPLYNEQTIDYDYAILLLESAVEFTANVGAIELPDEGYEVPANTLGIISGWGYTDFDSPQTPVTLQWTKIPFVNQADCQAAWTAWGSDIVITDQMQCIGGNNLVSSCMGDSGGPLTYTDVFGVKTKLIGISSWVEPSCSPTMPAGYSKVSAVRSWISGITNV